MRTPPGCVKWGRGNEQGAHGEHGGAPPGVPDRRRVGRGGPDQSNPPVRRPRGAWTRAQVSGGGRRPFSSIGTNTETATSTYEGGSGHALVARNGQARERLHSTSGPLGRRDGEGPALEGGQRYPHERGEAVSNQRSWERAPDPGEWARRASQPEGRKGIHTPMILAYSIP